jgi:hypothetical protein
MNKRVDVMKKYVLIVLPVLFAFSFFLESCSCGCGSNKDNVVKGYIAIVGNEPFTKLAVQSDDNKTFILQCSKELEKELWKNQGNRYFIQYSDLRKEGDSTILTVEKVIPILTENKTN